MQNNALWLYEVKPAICFVFYYELLCVRTEIKQTTCKARNTDNTFFFYQHFFKIATTWL